MTSARALLPGLPPLLVSAGAAICCLLAAGPTTGLFFGGIAFTALIVPPMLLSSERLLTHAAIATAALVGTAGIWLVSLGDPFVGFGHWSRSTLVLAAWVMALWGITSALRPLRLPAPLPAFIVLLLAAVWLAWPIWLSPWIAGRDELVGWLTPAHPLLAIDGALAGIGSPWSERPLMYNRLSILNQDVPYELPSTIFWTVLLHGIIGVIFLVLPRILKHKTRAATGEVGPVPVQQ